MRMPGPEEALLPVGQTRAAGEEGEQGPAAVLDRNERQDGDDGQTFVGSMVLLSVDLAGLAGHW